eukprot:4464912-Alexandrium_andersonii.AAC.1
MKEGRISLPAWWTNHRVGQVEAHCTLPRWLRQASVCGVEQAFYQAFAGATNDCKAQQGIGCKIGAERPRT